MRYVRFDKTIGPNNVFGHNDPNEEGTLQYWLKDYEIVDLNSSKEFIYVVNCPCLSMQYEKFDFSILDNLNCKIIINDSMDGSSWLPQEVTNFTLYLKVCGIDPKRVTLITQNYNFEGAKFPFKVVIWNLMESFARVRAKEWIDYNDDAKKFLCLNRTPHQHKINFINQMYKHNVLDQFNYSMPKVEGYEFLSSVYDTNNMIGGLYWDFPEHKKESLLYIVTETFFDIDHLRDISEKTWRPIALQMPFILVHQPFALRRLRDIGYKTFHSIWDESYDDIINGKERMAAIVDLVLQLNSRKDFKEMIDSCRDIVEHNFAMLKMRRPEENMLNEFRI